MPVSTRLVEYLDQPPPTPKRGKTYVFDSGSGTIIAELTEEAASLVRDHTIGIFDYDGETISAHPA